MTLQALMRGPMALSGRQTRIAKQQGAVTVDAAPFFSNQPVHAGMVVRVELTEYDHAQAIASPSCAEHPLDVLYEDDALIAVYKPAMLQCHPSPSSPRGSDTLEGRVQHFLHAPAHPVHRLDAETTGIVLFAKAPFVQAHLQQQMADGGFSKTYLAWVFGVPSPESGQVDAPIARLTPDSFTRVVRTDGQRAVSQYRLLRSTALGEGGSAALLSLSPVTGRTHQLRVHMAHIGCPMLGDTRYGTAQSLAASRSLGLAFHQLSAVSLRFIHPLSGKAVCLEAEPLFSPVMDRL